jgi:site-specific DNA-adenine methylase
MNNDDEPLVSSSSTKSTSKSIKPYTSKTIDRKIFPIPYHGGQTKMKRYLINQLINIDFDVYIDLFCGSAEVTLELMKYYMKKGIQKTFIINDIDEYLMLFHLFMRKKPRTLMKKLKRLNYNDFKKLREAGNYKPIDIFNLWINSKYYYMKFNERTGLYMNIYNDNFQVKPQKILKVHKLYKFHNIHIRNEDYLDLFENMDFKGNKVFVYLDPPYQRKRDLVTGFNNDEFVNFVKNLPYDFIMTTKIPIDFMECIYKENEKNNNRFICVYKKIKGININPDLGSIIDKDSSGIELENIDDGLLTTNAFVSVRPSKKIW